MGKRQTGRVAWLKWKRIKHEMHENDVALRSARVGLGGSGETQCVNERGENVVQNISPDLADS